MPESGSTIMGLRSRTIFLRIVYTSGKYEVIPTFPLPRGTRVTNATFDDVEEAKRVAEMFFRKWLVLVGLATTDILVPARR